MHVSPVGRVSVSARSTERLPEHATCQFAGTRNGYVSGGAPVGEDFPRTRIREEKARYGGGLERSGGSRRNRWRRAPWILRRRLWFHVATGWPRRALFLAVVRRLRTPGASPSDRRAF